MPNFISKKQLDIYEYRSDDGGFGIKVGDSPVFMGVDSEDIMEVVEDILRTKSEIKLNQDKWELVWPKELPKEV